MPADTLDPLSRRRALAGAFAAAVAALALGRIVPLASHAAPPSGGAGRNEVVSSRLGISAGEEIADVPLGTSGPALEEQLPLLFETAASLGVRIETASVGQGFFSDDGLLLSERDLDLLVSGRREAVNALAARLGLAWEQSSVFIFHPASPVSPVSPVSPSAPASPAPGAGTPPAALATATLPLPYGAQALTDEIYQALVAELSDGGHVRYAGPGSLLFVANTGDESEGEFRARMERVVRLLGQAGISSGPLQLGRAELLVADRDNYDDLIEAPNRSLAPAS
jgi:hypothetical protein